MSVGRLVTGFLGSRQEKDILLHILDEQQAVAVLDERPQGDSILRLTDNPKKKAPLILSYKLRNYVFHHEFSKIMFRLDAEKATGIIKCKTEPKYYKFIRDLSTLFLPTLRLFISEFTSNKNFIERDLDVEEEIERELLGRKFIIYTIGEKVAIRRKGQNKTASTATISFDFQRFAFVAEEGDSVCTIKSFNEFLLQFLGIDASDKLMVKATLGYFQDVDLFTGKQRGQRPFDATLLQAEFSVIEDQQQVQPVLRSKEKEKLIERLKQLLDGADLVSKAPPWPARLPPGEVRLLLRSLLESVRILQKPFEKMDWVQRGVFPLLLKVMQRNHTETLFNEVPIKIARHLCSSNSDGCRIFCTLCLEMVKYDWECVGVYGAIVTLVTLPDFCKIFVQQLGVPRLLDIYVKTSIMLLGEHQTNTMGDMDVTTTSNMSPRSSDVFSSDDNSFDSSDEDELPPEPTPSVGFSLGSSATASKIPAGIPKLSLPTLNIKAATKSRPRRDRALPENTQLFAQTSLAQLQGLASSLGETYLVQDLNALLKYLQEDKELANRKKQRSSLSVHSTISQEDKGSSDMSATVIGFRNASYYKIKCNILRIFAAVTSNSALLKYIPNPVNLLFSELLVSYNEGKKLYDSDFRQLIYTVLANCADSVEQIHRSKWIETTRGMTRGRVLRKRRKMDKFIWRVHNRLVPSLEAKDEHEIQIHIRLLVEYIQHCHTRVMVPQVADVCMETLLRIKEWVVTRGKLSVESGAYVQLFHEILELFDELVMQNRDPSLDEFLLFVLVENLEFWEFTKQYAGQLLLKSKLDRMFFGFQGSSHERKQLLHTYRIRIVKHYAVCWELLLRQQRALANEPKSVKRKQQKQDLRQLMEEMEVILKPTGGYIMQFFSSPMARSSEHVLVTIELLNLVAKVIESPKCIFVRKKKYIDFYIGYSYLSFIKLYHSIHSDPETMQHIAAHARVLLAFARQKNDKITMKFHQLRTMDFLVKEINLEYEITLDKKRAPEGKKPRNPESLQAALAQLQPTFPSSEAALPPTATSPPRTVIPLSPKNDRSPSPPTPASAGRVPSMPSLAESLDDKKAGVFSPTKSKRRKGYRLSLSLPSSKGSEVKANRASRTHSIESSGNLSSSTNSSNSNTSGGGVVVTASGSNSNSSSSSGASSALGKSALAMQSTTAKRAESETTPAVRPPGSGSGIRIPGLVLGAETTFDKIARTGQGQDVKPDDASDKEDNGSSAKSDDNESSSESGSGSEDESGSGSESDASSSASDSGHKGASKKRTARTKAGSESENSEEEEDDDDDEDEASGSESGSDEEGSSSNSGSDEEGSSSEEDEPVKPAKPKLALGLPSSVIKGGTALPQASTGAAPPKPVLSLGLPSSVIKGGTAAAAAAPALSPPAGGGSDSPSSDGKGAGGGGGGGVGGKSNAASKLAALGGGGGGGMAIPKLKLTAELTKNRVQQSKTVDMDTSNTTVGAFSKLEQRLDKNDPKFQLVLNGTNQKAAEDLPAKKQDTVAITQDYSRERSEHKLYQDKEVHITLLQLILTLMLTPLGTLEPLYSDQFPLNNKKHNVPFLLRMHLNHPLNRDIIPELADATRELGRSEYTLLKLLCTRLFQKDMYKNLMRLAIGAYGTVYRCRLVPEFQRMDVAIKLMPVPKNIHDRCVVHDIFTEILILDRFKKDSRISHTYDFGTDDEYYWIIMKRYKCSLKEWRRKQTAPLAQNLSLYLNIYMNVLNTFQFLTENGVNHFDVKCDNFLIQPLNEDHWTLEDEEEFWRPTSDIPNFSVTLADFGESKLYKDELDGYTTRNRGTEFTKSPEMLVVANASQKTRSTYDRRKKVGASSPSDIWSLGCLLYELLTGEFLFYDQDWVRFFIRITVPGQELIPPEKQAKFGGIPAIMDFFEFVFTRDPAYRPNIHDVIKKFKHVRTQITSGLSLQSISPRKLTIRQRKPMRNGADDGASLSPHGHEERGEVAVDGAGKAAVADGAGGDAEAGSSEKPQLMHSISQKKLMFEDKQPGINSIEINHFYRRCSKILDYLYLGAEEAASKRQYLKSELGITHIVNCTRFEPMFPNDFSYLSAPIDEAGTIKLQQVLDKIIGFIDEAAAHSGKVLVYSADGMSRSVAVIVGYLMEKNDWTFYEAFVHVKNFRYLVDPHQNFIRQLYDRWREKLSQKTKVQYQCLCGACTFSLITQVEEQLDCQCKLGDASNCPNYGCANFLEQMYKSYQYPTEVVRWCFTELSNMIGKFRKTTREYVPLKELGASTKVKAKITKKDWTLFKCTSCDFLTHALSTSDTRIAIVTNIPVGQSTY